MSSYIDAVSVQRALRDADGRIATEYCLALGRGNADPVILVLDLRDEIAMDILAQREGPEGPEAFLAEYRERGVMSVAVVGAPRDWACRALASYEKVEKVAVDIESFDQAGRFPVVLVGTTGAVLAPTALLTAAD
jgi:hypothetical protein